MAKSVGRVNHASQTDSHTLDGTSLVNTKKLMNKMKQFDAILVLMEKQFPERGAQECGCFGTDYF